MEEICITGISGRFPASPTVHHLSQALFANRTDLIQPHTRWPHSSLHLPAFMGQIPDLDKFDALFFNTSPNQANCYDPKVRKLLEVVYEAIIDAGLNPSSLSGTKTGVFLAISPETRNITHDSGLLTRSGSIVANTISYCFNFNGPSLAIDSACSSSLYALDLAVKSILNGSCNTAILAGAQTHLDLTQSKELHKMGVLNTDGKCKSFQNGRDGYTKSEAVVAIVLQQRARSLRIYASVAGSGCNVDGFKMDGISHPSVEKQVQLLRTVYETWGICKDHVCYVETHGTGTVVGDRVEATALAEFFGGDGRKRALLIGSVKSNLGHSETASGLVGLVKLCLTIAAGTIPANLHCDQVLAQDIPAIKNEVIKVVTRNTPYEGGLLAISAFGFGGANGHAVLRPPAPNQQPSTPPAFNTLIVASSSTKNGVENFLNSAQQHQNNKAYLALLNNIFHQSIANHTWRGYTILNPTSLSNSETVQMSSSKRQRPIWYCFSGMGSQWPAMAQHLLPHHPIFTKTVRECAKALQPYHLNLENILTNDNPLIFHDITNCFVAIVAVSVALVDCLRHVGIEPDGIFGHSLGEIACGYADGSLTAQQAVLIAFARGHVSNQLDAKNSLMAAVGMSMEDVAKILPAELAVACDNSRDNVTIAGPEEAVREFVAELNSRNIFSKIVDTGNIAFHCQNIKEGEKPLLDFFKTIIPEPKRRSSKWLSSSVPMDSWHEAKLNSAEYHTNNFLKQVRFRQVLNLVPADAIVIEIAPKGLLQAILRRNLPETTLKFHLMDDRCQDNFRFLSNTLGKLYLEGVAIDLRSVGNTENFPLDVKTPPISPLVVWDHGKTWQVPHYDRLLHFGKQIKINLSDKQFDYLNEHVINHQHLLPASAFLVMVWQTFAEMRMEHYEQVPIVFTDVQFRKAVVFMETETEVCLTINILEASGAFEVLQNAELICSGQIRVNKKFAASEVAEISITNEVIEADDFYKRFNLRQYYYGKRFQSMQKVGLNGTWSVLEWNENWITFLDAIYSHPLFFEESALWLPTHLDRLEINPLIERQKTNLLVYSGGAGYCGGVKFRKLMGQNVEKQSRHRGTLQKYEFIANNCPLDLDFEVGLRIVLEFAFEICFKSMLKIGIYQNCAIDAKMLANCMNKHKNWSFEAKTISKCEHFDLLISNSELDKSEIVDLLSLQTNCQLVFCRKSDLTDFDEIFTFSSKGHTYNLLQLKCHRLFSNEIVIQASNESFEWIEKLQTSSSIESKNSKIILYTQEANTGLVGFYNSLKLDHPHLVRHLQIVQIESTTAPPFASDNQFYRKQLNKNLPVNYLNRNNEWGTFHLIPFVGESIKQQQHFTAAPHKVYIIIGGLGGIGFELANFLIESGAQNLILNCRSQPKSGDQCYMLKKWQHAGAKVHLNYDRTETMEGARNLINFAHKSNKQIAGIFHSVLVLSDKEFAAMTSDDFSRVFNAKFHTVNNLQQMTIDDDLDFFVAFSSLTCSVGNWNQTNYSWANFALEQLCVNSPMNRRNLVIEWGPVADVGYYAKWRRQARQIQNSTILNAKPQDVESCLKHLEQLLVAKQSGVVACCLMDAKSSGDLVERNLLQIIFNKFGVDDSSIDDSISLINLGMDSLMSYEIGLIIEEKIGVKLDNVVIKKLTIADIKQMMLKQ